MYVKVISLMLSDPQLENLPQLEYLLEEDEEIIGFKPLQEGELQQKYFFPNYTSRKPKCHEQGVKRHHPNTESLCRIRDFMQDAIELASNEVRYFLWRYCQEVNAVSSLFPSSSLETLAFLPSKHRLMEKTVQHQPWPTKWLLCSQKMPLFQMPNLQPMMQSPKEHRCLSHIAPP